VKIVCLVAPAPHTFHFVNRIHERTPVSLVVWEEAQPQTTPPLRKRIQRLASPAAVMGAIGAASRAGERRRVTYSILGESARALDPSIEVMRVTSVNAPEVRARLEREKPDVLVDHGTSIVRDHVIATAPTALNLHWGLSPYYRGVRCTEWALINWDPYNIGVTIHELTLNIDGGPIWAQERAEVQPGDGVHSLNMQLTRRGTGLVINSLAAIASGQAPPSQPQERGIGFLTLGRQWTPALSAQIQHIERNGILANMLRHPARRALPIVEAERGTSAL
jgi:methionyl-tRNA formyltransferase